MFPNLNIGQLKERLKQPVQAFIRHTFFVVNNSAPSGCATWTGISTDGDNGKAELNAKLNSTTGDDTVSIQLID